MHLGLKIAPKQVQTLKPTLQQLQYYRLLQQTNLELEIDIREEVSQNPALEVEEVRRCPKCGEILLDGQPCVTCMSRKAEDSDRDGISNEKLDMMEEIYSNSYGTYEASTYESIPEDELPDAFAGMVRAITLEEHLKQRISLDHPNITPDELELALDIIDRIDSGTETSFEENEDRGIEKVVVQQARLDNPGLIKASDEELAAEFGVDIELLKKVRRKVADIDPIGSGLESSLEVLALQAELADALPEDERQILATVIRHHLKDISTDHYMKVGKKVGVPAKRLKELIEFMRRSFHIHPRRMFEESEVNAERENPYVSPDVRIREIDGEYAVEILDSGLPQLKINRFYMESYRKLKKDRNAFNSEEKKHIREYFERASTYIENLNSRRRTMLEITEEIVRHQAEFLKNGPLYLKKLTRKEVAEKIGVHPSTVSRALAVRYCWLPDNSIVSFNLFFNPSACYIEMIKQILDRETPEKVFSDEEIRDLMAERGHELSRRVITKYRKKGKIPASGRRKRILIKQWKEGLLDYDPSSEIGDDVTDETDGDDVISQTSDEEPESDVDNGNGSSPDLTADDSQEGPEIDEEPVVDDPGENTSTSIS